MKKTGFLSRDYALVLLWVIPLAAWPTTTDGSLAIKWAMAGFLVPLLCLFRLNALADTLVRLRRFWIYPLVLLLLYGISALVKPSLNVEKVTLHRWGLGLLLMLLFTSLHIHVKKFLLFQVLVGAFVIFYGVLTRLGYPLGNWGDDHVLISTLGNPNFVAQYLLMSVPFVIAGLVSFPKHPFLKVVLIFILFSAIATFYFCSSTGGNLGLVAEAIFGVYIFFSYRKSHVKKSLVLALVLVSTLLFVKFYSGNDIRAVFNGGQKFRMLAWQGTLEMIQETPLFGSGPGTFKMVYPVFRKQKERVVSNFSRVSRPHSDPLQYLSDTGVAGWGVLCAFIVLIFYAGLTVLKRDPVILAILASLLGTLVHGLVSMNLHNPAPFFLFFILSGQVFSSFRGLPPPSSNPSKMAWCSCLLLLFLVFPGLQILSADLHSRLGNEHHDFSVSHFRMNEKKFGWNLGQEHLDASNRILPGQFLNDYRLGLLYFQRSGYEQRELYLQKSLAAYKKSVREAPWYEDYSNNLGISYRSLGLPGKSFSFLYRAIHINPNYDQAYANLGLLFEGRGEILLAKKMYRKAIQNNARFADVYGNLATLYFRENNFTRAEELYRNAIKVAPGNAMQWTNLGIVLERLMKWRDAEDAYNRAYQLNPGQEKAVIGLSTVLIHFGRYSEALKILSAWPGGISTRVGKMIQDRKIELGRFLGTQKK